MDPGRAGSANAQDDADLRPQASADRLDRVVDALLAGEDASRGKRVVSRLRSGAMRATTCADLPECDQSRVRRTAAAIANGIVGLFDSDQRAAVTYLLTLLQLPLIEVGNAVRAYCYSIASYPLTVL